MLAQLLVCVLVVTLSRPPPISSRRQEYYEDDDDRNIYPDSDDSGDSDDSEDSDEQGEEEPPPPPAPSPAHPRRAAAARPPPAARAPRRPLDCYTCTYRAGQELKACIDPVKYLAYTSTCHSVDDKCFTSVEGASEQRVETIVRGCRSACVQSPIWSCCGESRCNNMTYRQPRRTTEAEFLQLLGQPAPSAAPPPLPAPAVHFFVSVLLLLHAALRVLM